MSRLMQFAPCDDRMTSLSSSMQQQQHQAGVIWDVGPGLVSEIYEDLGVNELKVAEASKGVLKPTSKHNAQKGGGSLVTPPMIPTTPSPAALRAPSKNHLHNGLNCSCKRRLLKYDGGQLDHFCTLSDEVILSIFHWLPKKSLTHCAKVCRRWRRLAYDDVFWRKIDLSASNFVPGILGLILRRGVIHTKLSRSTIASPVFDADIEESAMEEDIPAECVRSPPPFQALISEPLQLESLDLSACIADGPDTVKEILARCRSLKRLSLESCRVSGDTLACVAEHAASLQVLNLAMCHTSHTEGLAKLIKSAHKLESLNMSWMNLARQDLEGLTKMLPTGLKHLNLSGYREKLEDKDILNVVTRCHNLRELDLSDCTVLTEESLSAIVQNLPDLKHISLSRCYDIPFYAYSTLLELGKLGALDIFGVVQPRELTSLRHQLPKISINSFPFSAIARPTISPKRPHHIWGIKCDT